MKIVTEWPGEILGLADAPRSLPPGVRDRLEQALLADGLSTETTRPLGGDVSDRLEGALDDPMAGELGGVDKPRPLPPATDRALERAFARGSRRRRSVAVVGAAAAVVVVAAGLTVAVSDAGRSPSKAPTQALAPPTQHRAAGANGSTSSGLPSAASASQAPQALGSDHTATPTGPEAVARPVVTGISPASGPAAGDTSVTITGAGLSAATTVRFGTVPAHFRIVSASQLAAVSPAHGAGSIAVTVATGAGTTLAAGSAHFTYH